jgi:hypothetical protein
MAIAASLLGQRQRVSALYYFVHVNKYNSKCLRLFPNMYSSKKASKLNSNFESFNLILVADRAQSYVHSILQYCIDIPISNRV